MTRIGGSLALLIGRHRCRCLSQCRPIPPMRVLAVPSLGLAFIFAQRQLDRKGLIFK
jgi:hypothetical protein